MNIALIKHQQSTHTFQGSISMDSSEVLKTLSFGIVGMSDLAPMTTPIGIFLFWDETQL
jgi:hypothetical protein